jgi:hypothetical protein
MHTTGWEAKVRRDPSSKQLRVALIYYENGVEKTARWADATTTTRTSKYPPVPESLLHNLPNIPTSGTMKPTPRKTSTDKGYTYYQGKRMSINEYLRLVGL